MKELRALRSAPLPGKSLAVYDPSLDIMVDVLPCEDGYTQERALLGEVLQRVRPGELWIEDRNFCVLVFLLGLCARSAYFILREHEQFRFRPLGPMREVGVSETGAVAEQAIEPLYRRALAIWEQALGPDHPNTAQSLNNLALLYYKQGRYGEAEPLYRRALEIFESMLGPAHPTMATVRANYAALLKAMKRKDLRLNVQAAIRRVMRWWGVIAR